jgi:polysaccharide biosynthesis protein PslG
VSLRVVVVAALLALLMCAPASARSVPRGWLGVQADGPLTEPGNPFASEWDLMASSGVENVRVAFDWRAAQPTEGGPIDYSAMDAVVVAAAARRLPVLPVVHRTPDWAAAHPGQGAAATPRGTAAYVAFLRALVARYGPSGSLWAEQPGLPRMPIRDWQIWNEPNLTRYWSSQPFAKPYVKLLRASRKALRAADPGSRTILAGLPNESWIALRKVYKAGGRRTFDAVALHPYTGKPKNVIKLIEFARKEMRKYHDGRKPVWLTELSWPASKGKTGGAQGFITSESGQASRLKQALKLLAKARKRLKIERVFWYTWLSREGSQNAFDYSGLRRLRGDRVVTAHSLAVYRQAAKRLVS